MLGGFTIQILFTVLSVIRFDGLFCHFTCDLTVGSRNDNFCEILYLGVPNAKKESQFNEMTSLPSA